MQGNPAAKAAPNWRQEHERAIVTEFFSLLSIPNIASDTANIRTNAQSNQQLMERRGVKTRLLEVPGAPPLVYGETLKPGATRTVVIYAHYDG